MAEYEVLAPGGHAELVSQILQHAGGGTDLGITGATVGQFAKVATVDASGAPTSWAVESLTLTLTVTCATSDGVTVTGQTVTVRELGPDGPVFATAAYDGQPVSFSLPVGFVYHVSASDDLTGHYNPTTASGVMGDADVSVTLTYSDVLSIATAREIQEALDLGANLTSLVGETITCSRGNQTLTWVVSDYDSTASVVKLHMADCSLYSANQVFEPEQALMWCEDGLAAGSYTFKNDSTQVYFTLATAIPAGGQLKANATAFTTYESQSATSALETGTVSTTEIAGATDLGKTGDGLLNHHDRVTYGSNNWAESALFQLVNTDAQAGTPVARITRLSRPHAYAVDGLLRELDPDFLACVAEVDWKCSANNEYECPSSLGGVATKGQPYTVRARFGLLSEKEVFGSYDGVDAGDSLLGLYVGATADDRKMYRGTSAQHVWLRSPASSYSSNVRRVNTSGSAISNLALSAIAVVPACEIHKSASAS